ncbi:MAG: DUF2971 domain-containing protein [Bacteroidota bacterium]
MTYTDPQSSRGMWVFCTSKDNDSMEDKKPLYHYTSQKGLLGILQTQKLWMTNILYLNDSSEFKYTIDLVTSEIKNRKEQLEKKGLPLLPYRGDLYDRYNTVERVFDILSGEIPTQSYVFSLSTKENDLNQWRGYCPKEGGFSVGFDYKKLSSIVGDMNKKEDEGRYEIRECIYKKQVQMESVKQLIGIIDNKDTNKKLFYTELVNISSYFKDESFRYENEYRIIRYGIPKLKEIEYREGKSTIIPYIEFSPVDKLPISKIFVGPTPHPKLSKSSVKSLLESNGYEDVEVDISKIPYRSW